MAQLVAEHRPIIVELKVLRVIKQGMLHFEHSTLSNQ
jgi:hypothetical protein